MIRKSLAREFKQKILPNFFPNHFLPSLSKKFFQQKKCGSMDYFYFYFIFRVLHDIELISVFYNYFSTPILIRVDNPRQKIRQLWVNPPDSRPVPSGPPCAGAALYPLY